MLKLHKDIWNNLPCIVITMKQYGWFHFNFFLNGYPFPSHPFFPIMCKRSSNSVRKKIDRQTTFRLNVVTFSSSSSSFRCLFGKCIWDVIIVLIMLQHFWNMLSVIYFKIISSSLLQIFNSSPSFMIIR